MFEYALLIIGIGLVVYNGMKVLTVFASKVGQILAERESELIASLEKKNNDRTS